MHRHGSYRSKRRGGKSIQRFCCPRCGLAYTVLPVGMVPYRSSVKELEDYFDQRPAVEHGMGAVRWPRTLERALRPWESTTAFVRCARSNDQPCQCHRRSDLATC